jgi:hypothetical protein
MAGLWRSVGVLLWKSWRCKQRESRLNRGRSGRRWLYPALVTDIVMPLGLLLLVIQRLCIYNASLVTPGGGNLLSTALAESDDQVAAQAARTLQVDGITDAFSLPQMPQGQELKHEPATLLLAVLPLLLEQSNQSLAVLERHEAETLLQYLDGYSFCSLVVQFLVVSNWSDNFGFMYCCTQALPCGDGAGHLEFS